MQRKCDIVGCEKKHEAKGFCKNHYKSLLKYGNALQVEINRQEAKERKAEMERIRKENNGDITARGTKRWMMSTEGLCEVEGCQSPIRARRLCVKHHNRMRRNGTTELMGKKTNFN